MIPLERNQSLQWIVSNVHDDDVHALCKTDAGVRPLLLSGSKDSTVRSHVIASRASSQPGFVLASSRVPNYERWITGLDVFMDGSWVAGSRNGFLQCRDLSGRVRYYAGYPLQFDSAHAGSYKERNRSRIMSVKCLKNEESSENFQCLIGYPESFCQFDLTAQRVVRTFQFPHAQWVYGFCSVRPGFLATIHGTSLSLLREQGASWEIVRPIVRNPPVPRGDQIPFISSIESMSGAIETTEVISAVALSYFGGRTEVRDIETGEELYGAHEHTGRVWQSIPFTPVSYISCADDRTIKLWDTRRPRSVATFAGHPGRVSALCFLNGLRFVAATCPNDLRAPPYRAQFYYYDLRAMGEHEAPPASSVGRT